MTSAAGLDFGTSGARLTVINAGREVIWQDDQAYGSSAASADHRLWQAVLAQLLRGIPPAIASDIAAIAINGTSATVLLCDGQGALITEPLLYNNACGQAQQAPHKEIAPAGSPVLSATSSLVKLLWWRATLPTPVFQRARYLLHQADWLAYQLHGQLGLSDYHNALKLGYDVGALAYPDWLKSLELDRLLPHVYAPGDRFGQVSATASDGYGLPLHCTVMAGTTDSIAAFLASGARSPGEAVTSLGSTLVIKLLSQTRVDDSRYGIYSHRLGDLWLVGGASNTGGAVLKQYFTDAELQALSAQIAGDRPSPLDYYPLTQPGERFPINDPTWPPRLSPRPEEDAALLHGLLEGIARIEAQGYGLLTQLGATAPTKILTAGGGAQNVTWLTIRQRCLALPVAVAPSTLASFGTACLATEGLQRLTACP